MSIAIEQVDTPTECVRSLIAELDAELAAAYAPEQQHGLSLARIFRPGLLFFAARLDGEPVGCAGVALANGFAEVKRMYVRPHARGRGRGVARALLARLAEEARACGLSRLTLETGDAQLAAIRFYEREGFARCGAFGDYATMPPAAVERSVFFAKAIG
jgi:putative acetyltransferase